MSVEKERLDVLLVNKGLFSSRERAKRSIMAGEIFIDDKRVDKCGEQVPVSSNIIFKGEEMPYVSRGGYKLEKAIKSFNIKLDDYKCIDIGASTGGFTDCMLQNGAKKVFSIDVGYGQFAWKLRCDERVTLLERTNVRYVTSENLGELCDFASIDVSFISLKLVIPVAKRLLQENGTIVALIKPQFEAGRDKVGKKGVVRDPKTHIEVIHKVIDYSLLEELIPIGLDYSPIKGPEGNIEYVLYLSKDKNSEKMNKDIVEDVVKCAHNNLNKGE